ncbi:MAG: nucleotidyl transferase AbiEii/AbiGii toxin family protein [Methanosarcinales archaeon]|nr:nucleotidyl transferase AbiEii/AbiGii toxin family protein [Methanosarcinales archaeon]
MYNYNEMSEVTGFHQLEVEKVCRISTMLEKIMDVPFLKERLSLIGGTAINFIYTKPLARLSVDLDFNYLHIDDSDWGEVRTRIDRTIKQIIYTQGYADTDIKIDSSYPLGRMVIYYRNSVGKMDSFQIEIGYMRRFPLLKTDILAEFNHVCRNYTFKVKTPHKEELFANKWCTFLQRQTARDLYDVYTIAKQDFDLDVFRKCAVVESIFMGTQKLTEINVNNLIRKSSLSDNLTRMVNLGNNVDYQTIKQEVLDFSQKITGQLKENEIKMIENFYAQSVFIPDLIDDDGIFNEKLKDHPIIKWKYLKAKR